jgi:hypothetical protein
MLPPVELDDDPLLQAGEIRDEAADRNLPAKVQAGRAEQAQLTPKPALTGGRFAAQVASELDRKRRLRPARGSLAVNLF